MLRLFVLFFVWYIAQSDKGFWGRYNQKIGLTNGDDLPALSNANILGNYQSGKLEALRAANKFPGRPEASIKLNIKFNFDKIKKAAGELNAEGIATAGLTGKPLEILAAKIYTDDTLYSGHFSGFWTLNTDTTHDDDKFMGRALYEATHRPERNNLWRDAPLITYMGRARAVIQLLANVEDGVGYADPTSYISGPQSTSTDLNIARSFAKRAREDEGDPVGVIFKIEIPQGTEAEFGALDVQGISDHSQEKEIIFFDLPAKYITYHQIYDVKWKDAQPVRDQISFTQQLVSNQVLYDAINGEAKKLLELIWRYLARWKNTELDTIAADNTFGYWPGGAGEVGRTAIIFKQVVDGGNIRERMNLIFGFARGGERCQYMWDDIITKAIAPGNLPDYINQDQIDSRTTRISNSIGIEVDEHELELFRYLLSSRYQSAALCYESVRTLDSPVTFARSDIRKLDEIHGKLKVPLNKYISPPLSDREKTFLSTKPEFPGGFLSDSQIIPWETGYSSFEIILRSSYGIVAYEHNRLLIAAPSTSVQMVLDVAHQFKGLNDKLLMAGLAIYMGNTPDHSLEEVLLGGHIYAGFDNYFLNQDPYDYLMDIIKKIGIDGLDTETIDQWVTARAVSNPPRGTVMLAFAHKEQLNMYENNILEKEFKIKRLEKKSNQKVQSVKNEYHANQVHGGRLLKLRRVHR